MMMRRYVSSSSAASSASPSPRGGSRARKLNPSRATSGRHANKAAFVAASSDKTLPKNNDNGIGTGTQRQLERNTAAHNTPRKEATLLIDCPDSKGVVAASASMLYGQGCNILETDQHSQPDAGLFFQRVHFDYSDCYLGNSDASIRGLEAAIDSVATRFDMKWTISYANKQKRMAVLVSKFDHCLYDILLRKNSKELNCEIPLIISNHDTLRPVAEQFDTPFYHLPMEKMPAAASPEEKLEAKMKHEAQIERLLKEFDVDVVVLARYMQVLSDEFCRRHESHTINIHHSFLPAFEGGYPYHRAYDRGVKIIGATAHYITADLDAGPIIDQDVIRISHRDSVEDMIQKGRNLERSVLSRALSWHLQDRILIHNNKTVVFGY
jgi:formyltetrahydrofolate deformylase